MVIKGVRVVGKNEKLESFKLESLKLKSFAEVGKSQVKLERTDFQTFQLQPELSYCSETFQLQKKLPNFVRCLPTLSGAFQLRWALSNFAGLFPTSAKLSNFGLSSLELSNFSFFPTALSNYTHPLNKFAL